MRQLFIFLGLLLISQGVLSSILDVFGLTNGHEPRVALYCGKVPFYIDLETGAWVADSDGKQACDGDKENVKSLCKKVYPKLNISNVVEANHDVEFKNWCTPGSSQCNDVRKVVPYRCLVNEYEADALMVPDTCKFDHIHDRELCMSHDQWRDRASEICSSKYGLKLKDFGILLSCNTDLFTGVEFVCCPEKVVADAEIAYQKAQKKEEERIKKLLEEKKEAKEKEEKEAKEKEEKEAKEKEDEKSHKHEKVILIPKKSEINHELFVNAIRNFQKYLPVETKGCDRTAYLKKQADMEERHRNEIAAIVDEWDEAEKRYNELKVKDPATAEEKMKRTLEVFRQTLAALEQETKEEKDRLRAEHADCITTQINKDKRDAMIGYLEAIEEEPVSAEKILEAVRTFIKVCEHDRVHSLRHFEHVRNRDPKKADGMRDELLVHLKNLNKVVNDSMALLNYLPEVSEQFGITGPIGGAILKPRLQMPEEKHEHGRVKEILKHATKKYGMVEAVPITNKLNPTDDIPVEPKPVDVSTPNFNKEEVLTKIGVEEQAYNAEKELIEREMKEQEIKEREGMDDEDDEDDEDEDADDEEDEHEKKIRINSRMHKEHKRSQFAITAILGLSFGILVIMLLIVIAMIVRRRRVKVTRVVLSENNDDREHLVQMQKSGFENPTYKFYYY